MISGSRIASVKGRLLAVGVSCLVAALLTEAALRMMGVAYPIFVQADPVLGVDHIPNSAGWLDGEGRAYIRYNSDGLRGGEYAVPKPPNTVRVALLGDS